MSRARQRRPGIRQPGNDLLRSGAFGRSEDSGGRIDRERAPAAQEKGPAGRHHQRYQEAFLLSQAGRQASSETGARAKTQSQEAPARAGVSTTDRRGSDRWSSKTGSSGAWTARRSSSGRRESSSFSP